MLLGLLMYRGAVHLDVARFFLVTGVLLIFVAAGILAYGVHDLQEAQILPGLNTLAFDLSGVLAPDSALGTVLKGILNFSPATTILQALVWVCYVVVVLFAFLRSPRPVVSSATATA